MTTKHQISCITKSDRENPHERILAIGGLTGSYRWGLTQIQAIQAIEKKEMEFYVRNSGSIVRVIVATSRFGNKYLKTENDGEQPNNLLSLPEC